MFEELTSLFETQILTELRRDCAGHIALAWKRMFV
jgi:hypothetical protein